MPSLRPILIAASLVAALVVAASPLPAAAQTAATPPPGDLGGKQPVSNAATNTDQGNARTTWSPSLPAPAVGDEAPPTAFLDAARRAIAANRSGEAQEALERAESRALDRAVRPSKAGQPSRQPLVSQIAQARQLLGDGDRLGALRLIEKALANPEATEAD
jgi:hypothetical protein